MDILNMDCVIKILTHLPVRDRQSSGRVSTVWKSSADHLFAAQKNLRFVSRLQSHRLKCDNTYDTIVWPTNYIKYTTYCELIQRFPNLKSLAFVGFDHWNDPIINQLITSCPALTVLEFIYCDGLGRNRNDDFFYMNVTDNGWQRLITAYGNQLSQLVLQDCDLDDRQLALIVDGFRQLVLLDITGNHIRHSEPLLSRICPTIQLVRLGPRLINGNHVAIELPVMALASGSGRHLQELHLQFFLTRQLTTLSAFTSLKRLVIKFTKPLFRDQEFDLFSAIAAIKTLECLEILEYNSHDGIMSLTANQLVALVRGCPQLKRLVITCDVWCDSILSDWLIRQILQYNPRLTHLSFCPGNFECSDNTLQMLARLPLEYLSLTGFPAFTARGYISLLENCHTLNTCHIEDCFEITQNFVDSVIQLFNGHPNRYLTLQISESKISAQIPTQMSRNLKFIINQTSDNNNNSNERNKWQTSLLSANGVSFAKTLVSIITFIASFTAIIFTIIMYLLHYFLSKLFTKLTIILLSSLLTTLSVIPLLAGYFTNVYVVDDSAKYEEGW